MSERICITCVLSSIVITYVGEEGVLRIVCPIGLLVRHVFCSDFFVVLKEGCDL